MEQSDGIQQQSRVGSETKTHDGTKTTTEDIKGWWSNWQTIVLVMCYFVRCCGSSVVVIVVEGFGTDGDTDVVVVCWW